MDLVSASQSYFKRIFQEVSDLKILLLEEDTTKIVSSCITQSNLLEQQIYLTVLLGNKREKLRHLKCVAFLRPTPTTLRLLCEELRDPKYAEYHLYFTNVIPKSFLERLAESDDFEAVKSIQEFFLDYLVVNNDLASFNIPHIIEDSPDNWQDGAFHRTHQGIISLLLSLKKKPVIRYDNNSLLCLKLAEEVSYTIQHESQLFNFRKPDTAPILLLLDRKNDPITPLLTQWTYQAMVHELFGIDNGRVSFSNSTSDNEKSTEIVLNPTLDPFYKETRFDNFGDLGVKIKDYVSHLQTKSTKKASEIESIADMKQFLEAYPEYRRLSGNVSKHVSLVSEISQVVQRENLLEVGEVEQSLVCNEPQSTDFNDIQRLLFSNISENTKLRLAALYSLRFERIDPAKVSALQQMLIAGGVNPLKVSVIPTLLHVAGYSFRQGDVFPPSNLFSRARSGLKGLRGVENVYIQHNPFLKSILLDLIQGRLKETTHPFLNSETRAQTSNEKPQDIIVVIVGGATYEEAHFVSEFNATQPGVRIILAGTTILNSTAYIDDIMYMSTRIK
ncbi:vacuolar sorting protein Vps45 [Schizosaccharomyces pombe]|uniref:Vacuolar protein sorting-associated protein 45 n=1 Tax=Schizosaccharomyces pombe (strain 972 / ATCC 24843) TaxID=284812 RepID=VPS45_SCHPO|nr:vacuolar sorting protein Vps45 [Schizosaccharomyces pombe]Q09805.1 RecName: Full=Vacuolar protein sorting-associated protein 45 [Schizosaccharomyces pombe 972h-]CAA91168.1 vacuolar sorting protein Vps45 [Schizosaccharomyces pombe]|eukprot:NP_593083.1 vacuolar sorting protein Vps45 [Schizosaccharomyces pombe]